MSELLEESQVSFFRFLCFQQLFFSYQGDAASGITTKVSTLHLKHDESHVLFCLEKYLLLISEGIWDKYLV